MCKSIHTYTNLRVLCGSYHSVSIKNSRQVVQETCAEGRANMPPWPGICMPTGTPPIIPANAIGPLGHWAMGPCIKRNNNQLILKGLEFHGDTSRVYIYILGVYI